MKRSTVKLVIRGETIRMLIGIELVHAAGGNVDARLLDTGDPVAGCELERLADTVSPATGCQLARL
jgi:hypothetical protein